MDPQFRRRRTLEAIKRIMARESLNQPLMMIFEDLHWIDAETQALLNLLVDTIANARILLLVNYRPEYRHEWGSRTQYTQLRLDPLGRESAEEMLNVLLAASPVSSPSISLADQGDVGEPDTAHRVRVTDDLGPLKRVIIERTDGTPFFIEEMVQSLFEEGALERNGMVKLASPISAVKVPATVQAVLASRLDRLPAVEKEFLQTLAVLGHQFTLSLVQRVTLKSSDELEQMLSQLQLREFINEQPAVGEVNYNFKHALTHDVAYNSLLLERRKALHEIIAQSLEALFVDSIDEHLVDLSYHYSRSRNDSRAIDYLIRAGEQAQQRSAYSQAATCLEQALTRLNNQPAGAERDRTEIAIRTGLADAAIVISGYAAAEYEHHLTRRHELAQRLGDTTQIFYSLVGMSVLSAFRLELSRAQDIGWKLLGIADHEHDPDMQLQAHGSLANILWLMGDLIGSREHCEKGLRLFAHEQPLADGDEHWRAACQFHACLCTAALGFPDKALRRALEFLAWARERPKLLPLAFALNCVATVLVWRGEGEQALKYADAHSHSPPNTASAIGIHSGKLCMARRSRYWESQPRPSPR